MVNSIIKNESIKLELNSSERKIDEKEKKDEINISSDYDDLDSYGLNSFRSDANELNILSNPIFEKSKIPIKLNACK